MFLFFLDILDNSPLSDVSFAVIFFHSVACLLILLSLSFAEQKFLILMKSRLSPIFFMDHEEESRGRERWEQPQRVELEPLAI